MAALLQNDEGQHNHVDIQVRRADAQTPVVLATEQPLPDDIDGVAGDFLAGATLCELFRGQEGGCRDEGDERRRGERWGRTHDVAAVFGVLPAVFLVVVPQEIPCTSGGNGSVTLRAKEAGNVRAESTAELVQQLAHLDGLLDPVKHIAPDERMCAPPPPLYLAYDAARRRTCGSADRRHRRTPEGTSLGGRNAVLRDAVSRHQCRVLGIIGDEVEVHRRGR